MSSWMELKFVWWILVGSDRVEIDDFGVACSCISGGSQTSELPREEEGKRGVEGVGSLLGKR